MYWYILSVSYSWIKITWIKREEKLCDSGKNVVHLLISEYVQVSGLTLYRMVMPIGTPFLKEKIN